MQARSENSWNSFTEALCILVLVVLGILGQPSVRVRSAPEFGPAPANAVVLRVLGLPWSFEITAGAAKDRAFQITVSTPERNGGSAFEYNDYR